MVLVFTAKMVSFGYGELPSGEVGYGTSGSGPLGLLHWRFGGFGSGSYGGQAGIVKLKDAHYMALSPNAHVPYPSSEAEGEATTPSRIDDPIPFDASGVVDQVEVRALEAIRGEQAYEWIRAVDENYEPPQAGMDYVLVRVEARLTRASGDLVLVASGMFSLVGADGAVYERPDVLTSVPRIDAVLYPGGVNQGWVLLQAAVHDGRLVLAVDSPFEGSEADRIYLELP